MLPSCLPRCQWASSLDCLLGTCRIQTYSKLTVIKEYIEPVRTIMMDVHCRPRYTSNIVQVQFKKIWCVRIQQQQWWICTLNRVVAMSCTISTGGMPHPVGGVVIRGMRYDPSCLVPKQYGNETSSQNRFSERGNITIFFTKAEWPATPGHMMKLLTC